MFTSFLSFISSKFGISIIFLLICVSVYGYMKIELLNKEEKITELKQEIYILKSENENLKMVKEQLEKEQKLKNNTIEGLKKQLDEQYKINAELAISIKRKNKIFQKSKTKYIKKGKENTVGIIDLKSSKELTNFLNDQTKKWNK